MKIGDTVTRMLAGRVPMKLQITEIHNDRIVCGMWEFDPVTGKEIDNFIPVIVSHLVMHHGKIKCTKN